MALPTSLGTPKTRTSRCSSDEVCAGQSLGVAEGSVGAHPRQTLWTVHGGRALAGGLVSLGALRQISPQAAAILERYLADEASCAPASAFRQFFHTLCWGNFADLDLSLLAGVDDPADHHALVEELRRYHAYLRRQRERVERFHEAYRGWLDACERELPAEYVERLRGLRRRFGSVTYGRITGLTTRSGLRRFVADPVGHMVAFERAFAECERQQAAHRQHAAGSDPGVTPQEIEQALTTLGVSAGASPVEVRRAYRHRAKLLHPDRQGERCAAQMVELNAAYHLVSTYHRAAAAARRSEPYEPGVGCRN